jgi:sugar phosphate isomerase/epimerase
VRDREWGLPPTKAFDKAVREYTMINMQRICEAAKKAACPIVFCSFARPDVEHLEGMERTAFNAIFNDRLGRDILSYARAVDAYNAALRDMCGSMGVPYIAVSEGLTGGSERFIDHCHEYLNGIERKADLIFEGIKNLVAAKWKPAAPANPPVTQ